MYKAADHIVAVGQGYRDNILTKVDVRDRISVITNGVDLTHFTPSDADSNPKQDDPRRPFVCSYIGTIGMAHGLEVVVKAARILQQGGRNDIHFQLVGDGANRARLEEEARQHGVSDMIQFTGRLPKTEIPRILADSDACLIHLKGCDLFETVIPSKIFETMAMQRPIIMGVKGEAARIVEEANAGLTMEPDCPESLVQAVTALADDADLTRRLGQHARAFVTEHYNRDVLAEQFLHVMEIVAGVEPIDEQELGAASGPGGSHESRRGPVAPV